jgi:hypothetical protein
MSRIQAQLAIDEDRYQEVVRLAERQERPITEILGELVDLGLERFTENRQRKFEALDELVALRQDFESRTGPYRGDLIAEVRAERDQQIERVLSRAQEP